MLRALIFDVDGTLADTEEMHRQAFNVAFRTMDLDWHWDRRTYRHLLQVAGGKERLAFHIQQLDVDDAERAALFEQVREIHRIKTRLYAAFVGQGRAPLRPGIRRLLREARAEGVELGIATTTTPDNVEALVRGTLGADGMNWFATIAAGDAVLHKKPAPDVFHLALAALGADAAECVAFEDSVNGLRSAQAAALFTVVTPTPWSTDHELATLAGADLLLPSLGDPDAPLPAADAARIGAPFLGLRQLRALCATRQQRPLPPARATAAGHPHAPESWTISPSGPGTARAA